MIYVYEIKNKVTLVRYIGRTSNPKRRWYRHLRDLRCNEHHSIYLQQAYNDYGLEAFEFNILNTCKTLEEACKLEENYIRFSDKDSLYNVSINSNGGDNISYHEFQPIIADNIRKGLLNKFSNMSESSKQQLSEASKGTLNNNYKHGKYTQENLRARKELWRNGSHEEKYSYCIGKPSWNKGLKKKSIQVVCEGVLYQSITQTTKTYNKSRAHMSKIIHSTLDEHKDFFIYDPINDSNSYEEFDDNLIEIYRSRSHYYNNYYNKYSNSTNVPKYSCEGCTYNSIKEASDAYNISTKEMSYRISSKSKKWVHFYKL